MAIGRAADDVRAAIDAAGGAMPFRRFMELALYGPHGFYTDPAGSGRAGRRGDFLTSPEVGPLFGAVVARFLDAEWERLGRPDPFTVVDAGAGPGTLARARARRPARRAAPRCATSPSRCRRPSGRRHPAGVESRRRAARRADRRRRARQRAARQPAVPARRVRRRRGARRTSSPGADGAFVEVLSAPLDPLPAVLPATAGARRRGPRCRTPPRRGWPRPGGSCGEGRSSSIDYARPTTAELAGLDRGGSGCARTAANERGGHYLADPGDQDITADVALDQLPEPDAGPHAGRSSCAGGASTSSSTEGRRAWERGGRGARPRRAADAQPDRARPRRCSTRPGSAGSAPCSGLPRSVDRRTVGSAAPVRGGRVDEAVQPEPPAQQPNEPTGPARRTRPTRLRDRRPCWRSSWSPGSSPGRSVAATPATPSPATRSASRRRRPWPRRPPTAPATTGPGVAAVDRAADATCRHAATDRTTDDRRPPTPAPTLPPTTPAPTAARPSRRRSPACRRRRCRRASAPRRCRRPPTPTSSGGWCRTSPPTPSSSRRPSRPRSRSTNCWRRVATTSPCPARSRRSARPCGWTSPLAVNSRWERDGRRIASSDLGRRDAPGFGECLGNDGDPLEDGSYQYVAIDSEGHESAAGGIVVGAVRLDQVFTNNTSVPVCAIRVAPSVSRYFEVYVYTASPIAPRRLGHGAGRRRRPGRRDGRLPRRGRPTAALATFSFDPQPGVPQPLKP